MNLLIFLSCMFFYIHAENSAYTEIHYPPLWNIVPSSLKNYPLINDSLSLNQYRLINPWYYTDRLGLYKILINITTPYMPFCSLSNASNILFGLPSQFGWQFKSNRLFTNGTLNISIDSWWASANYYLSVIPFLAAVDAGLIDQQQTFRLVKYENFCSNSIECFEQVPNAMKQWQRFFIHLQQANKNIDDKIIDQQYLAPMWSAYKASIDDALPLIESKLALLPSNLERLFGYGWARLINLIAMTRKNTNLYETIKNQHRFLPFRMLLDSDQEQELNDFSDLVNQSLEGLLRIRFDWLYYIEKFWEKLTCNYQGRIYAQYTLEYMAVSKFLSFKYLTQAIINSCLYRCDRSHKNDL